MAEWIRLVNGSFEPYSFGKLRQDNDKTSFTSNPSAATLAEYGVYELTVAAQPAYDPNTERLEEGDIAPNGDGFERQWNIVPIPDIEQELALSMKREGMGTPRLGARLALIDAGLWDSIPAQIDAIPDPVAKAKALAYFEDAQTWRRKDPTLLSLAAGLGLDDAALDALFEAAEVAIEAMG